MTQTHTLAEWLAFLSLGASGYASFSVFYFLLVDADRADLDPRPLARRAVKTGHQLAVHAGHDVNRAIATCQRAAALSLRDAAISLAALLALLFPATGGTR